jgi:hypothetical protein
MYVAGDTNSRAFTVELAFAIQVFVSKGPTILYSLFLSKEDIACFQNIDSFPPTTGTMPKEEPKKLCISSYSCEG